MFKFVLISNEMLDNCTGVVGCGTVKREVDSTVGKVEAIGSCTGVTLDQGHLTGLRYR